MFKDVMDKIEFKMTKSRLLEDLTFSEGLALWDEKERLRVRNFELEQVLEDVALSDPSGLCAKIREKEDQIEKLRSIILDLRMQLGWSTDEPYRYTSTFE